MNPAPAGKPRRWLILGYGNALRGDDAAGPALAARVAARAWPGVTARAVPQLTPELAADLAECDGVVFLDARAGGGTVELTALRPEPEDRPAGHGSSPASLLALARTVYGTAPRAWWLTLPAVDFRLGAELSPTTRRALEEAEGRLRALLTADHAM